VVKIDCMLQRQIVIKAFGTQIDIEDPAYTKYYAGTSFQSIVWILISVIVTNNRTLPLQESYENSHYIMMTTTKLMSCI